MFLSFAGADLNIEYFYGFGIHGNHDRCQAIKIDPSHNYYVIVVTTRHWAGSGTNDPFIIIGDPKDGSAYKMVSYFHGN